MSVPSSEIGDMESNDGISKENERSDDKKTNYHRHRAKKQWRAAALMARKLSDPWEGLGFEDIKEEVVIRHMYYPKTRTWKNDKIVVKIQRKPFAHGAMRECFRMKKLSKFSQNPNWQNASNYVAKRYMKPVDIDTYFEDVKLQMDAKLWGDKYSKLNVPKKVDFCQTYLIEFEEREGSPLYGVEHFIDGGYIKYNSNSGFVSEVNRLTPQAFSHFTFEKSNHQLIVVDIQGVGDLYTDPQMHTVDMQDYKEANLGTRGMALFFSSHICNPLCETLGLTQFDLSEEEQERIRTKRWNFSTSTTRISDISEADLESASITSDDAISLEQPPVQKEKRAPGNLCLQLSSSLVNGEGIGGKAWLLGGGNSSVPSINLDSPLPLESPSSINSPGIAISISSPAACAKENGQKKTPLELPDDGVGISASVNRVKSGSRDKDDDSHHHQYETDSLRILGLIHFNLAEYHEVGRFSRDHLPDLKSSMYHLTKSAQCGNVGALYMLARIYLQQSHEKFWNLTVQVTPEHECEGMEYLVQAAENGLRVAMFEVARALDTGLGLGRAPSNDHAFTAKQRTRNWREAVDWYAKVLTAPDQDSMASCLDPDYLAMPDQDYSILARMAEMYHTGGHGLEKNPQKSGELYTEAAEAAMNGMKGKLSTKYYMLAEQAWSEV